MDSEKSNHTSIPSRCGSSPTKSSLQSSLQLGTLLILSVLTAGLIYDTVVLIFNRLLGLFILYILLRLVFHWNPNIAYVTPLIKYGRHGFNILVIVCIETTGNICTYLAEGLYKDMDGAAATARKVFYHHEHFNLNSP